MTTTSVSIPLSTMAATHLRKLLDAATTANQRVADFIDTAAAVLEVTPGAYNFDVRQMAFTPVPSADVPVVEEVPR